MKRIAIGAISALALLAPMIATPSYAGQGAAGAYQMQQNDRGDRNNGGDRSRDNDARRDQSNNNDRQYNGDRGNDRVDNRNFDRGNNWRANDDRRDGRDYRRVDNDRRDWDRRDWRRGDRLPSYYRSHYREVNYRDHGWRQPPRGYHYVRDDRGNALLVGIATGAILGVILSGN